MPDFFDNQIREFLETKTKIYEELNVALQEKDYKEVNRLAHYFATSCGIVGAKKLWALCKDLEEKAQDKSQFSECEECFEKMRQEGLLVEEQLTEEIACTELKVAN